MEHDFLEKPTSLFNIRYIVEYSFRKDGKGNRSRKVYTCFHYEEKLNIEAREHFVKNKGKKLEGLIVERVNYEKVADR